MQPMTTTPTDEPTITPNAQEPSAQPILPFVYVALAAIAIVTTCAVLGRVVKLKPQKTRVN